MKIRIAALAAFATLALAAPASAQEGYMQEYVVCKQNAQQEHLILHADAVAFAQAYARCHNRLVFQILASDITDTSAERTFAACMASNVSAFVRTGDAGEYLVRGYPRCMDEYELNNG